MDKESMIILETECLILRKLGQIDIKDLVEILQDPLVVYAYEHEFTDDDIQKWLDRQTMRYN